MTVRFEMTVVGIDRLLAGLSVAPEMERKASRSAMLRSVLLVEAEAKARVRRRSGRLFSSIAGEVIPAGEAVEGKVSTNVEYAPYIEFGTRPHEIVAHGQALMLPISPMAGSGGAIFGGARLSGAPRAGQQVAFFKRVHHPGTRAMPFMKPALDDNIAVIEGFFKAAAEAALEAAAHGG